MNTMQRITKLLGEAQESLEMLSGGEAGMLDDGTTRDDIAAMIDAVRDMADFLETECYCRLTRTSGRQTEDMVDGWLEEAAKVDARRGEVAS